MSCHWVALTPPSSWVDPAAPKLSPPAWDTRSWWFMRLMNRSNMSFSARRAALEHLGWKWISTRERNILKLKVWLLELERYPEMFRKRVLSVYNLTICQMLPIHSPLIISQGKQNLNLLYICLVQRTLNCKITLQICIVSESILTCKTLCNLT